MADEINLQVSLRLRKGTLDASRQASYRADMVGTNRGPSPGVLQVSLDGVNVDFSQLSQPGLCWLTNLGTGDEDVDEAENCYVEYGMFDPTTSVHEFIPLGEILPGESYALRLSRFLSQEFGTESGTGTTGQNSVLRIKAIGFSQNVVVEAWER